MPLPRRSHVVVVTVVVVPLDPGTWYRCPDINSFRCHPIKNIMEEEEYEDEWEQWANPLPISCMTGMKMLLLSLYQHLGTQSQRTYHNDGVAFPWIGIKQLQ